MVWTVLVSAGAFVAVMLYIIYILPKQAGPGDSQ
jgi:hypothetical protein